MDVLMVDEPQIAKGANQLPLGARSDTMSR